MIQTCINNIVVYTINIVYQSSLTALDQNPTEIQKLYRLIRN